MAGLRNPSRALIAWLVPDAVQQLWQQDIALSYAGRYEDCRALSSSNLINFGHLSRSLAESHRREFQSLGLPPGERFVYIDIGTPKAAE